MSWEEKEEPKIIDKEKYVEEKEISSKEELKPEIKEEEEPTIKEKEKEE